VVGPIVAAAAAVAAPPPICRIDSVLDDVSCGVAAVAAGVAGVAPVEAAAKALAATIIREDKFRRIHDF